MMADPISRFLLITLMASLKDIPSMGAQTYPGESLSLSQLVFALNEGLKRTVGSPTYVANVADLN